MTADAVPPESATATPSPTGAGDERGLLTLPAFRGLMIANVLSAIAYGSSRFVFVWLIGELTEWNTATAILGIVIGLPPLLLSAWAGSLADRLDPQRLGIVLAAASTIGFAATAVLVAADVMTVPLAMVCAFVTAIAPSMLFPLLQALVPSVVPTGRLMQGVAIQNLSMMVAMIFGTFLGGAVIQGLGIAAGFWQLALAGALAVVAFVLTPLPHSLTGSEGRRPGAIRAGIRIAATTEPMRSLLALTAVMGVAITTSVLLLPEFARDVLDTESLAASGLTAFLSIGIVITSMLLATRWKPRRPGRLLTVMTCTMLGGGLVLIGSSRAYAVTALFAFAWGLSGGIAMTLMRSLLQMNTPPEMMGRVMGLSAMAQNGVFPVASLMLAGIVAATSVTSAMVIAGVICAVLTWLLAIPPHVRRL